MHLKSSFKLNEDETYFSNLMKLYFYDFNYLRFFPIENTMKLGTRSAYSLRDNSFPVNTNEATWKSSDSSVAQFNGNVLTAKKVGSTTISISVGNQVLLTKEITVIAADR